MHVHAGNISINLMKLKITASNTFHTGGLLLKGLSLNLCDIEEALKGTALYAKVKISFLEPSVGGTKSLNV